MDSRPFSHDPLTGITETFHYDDVTESVTIETVQTIDLDDRNRALYNAASDWGPNRWKGDLHWVGAIPMVEYYRLKREGILDDDKALMKYLNSSDNLILRTMPGRL